MQPLSFRDRLQPAVWSTLSPSERLNTLQEVENDLAAEQGRSPAEVKVFQGSVTRGYYDHADGPTGSIYINEELLLNNDALGAVCTTAHESRHAFQQHSVRVPGAHFDSERVSAWGHNWAAYKTSEGEIVVIWPPGQNPPQQPSQGSFWDYYWQVVEEDARNYANNVVFGWFPSTKADNYTPCPL